MNTPHRSALALVSALALLGTGCIHHEETVYQEPPRVAVSFENETAGRVFYEALSRSPNGRREESSTEVSLPIVFRHKVKTVRGPNAAFNDAVIRCDTDRDGKITELEAALFSGQVK
jgi:hypothetical protein